MAVEKAPPAFVKRFPGTELYILVSVRLREDAQVRIDGYGLPFRNPEHPEVEGWLNQNTPIVGTLTLLDFLAQRTFYLAMSITPATRVKEWNDARLPLPFNYPYGTDHHWPAGNNGATGLARYADLLERTKSAEMFRPAYR
jgi:hypothetical protein